MQVTERKTSRFADAAAALKGGAFDVLVKVSFPFLLGAAGTGVVKVLDHETRLDLIETRRAETTENVRDAAKDRAQLATRLTSLQTQVAVSQATNAETVKRLDRLESKLDEVLKELRRQR